MNSEAPFDRLRHGVIAVEITVVGEAVDLLLRELNHHHADPEPPARAMHLYPCRGGRATVPAQRYAKVSPSLEG